AAVPAPAGGSPWPARGRSAIAPAARACPHATASRPRCTQRERTLAAERRPAIVARAAEEHVMPRDDVVAFALDALERRLERVVLERVDPAALIAHQVVVMSLGPDRLVVRPAGAELDLLYQAALLQQIERPVDARDADGVAAAPDRVPDLLR